jgi:two-component system chemotaxis response regulator CheB
LPEDLPAAVLVVLHLSPAFKSQLPEILTQRGALPAIYPSDGAPLERGRIYVAPPDRHLLVEKSKVTLAFGPKENFSRPAIDPLFRSAAQSWGSRAFGVVLSGNLSDGSAGLWSIHRGGGTTIVQDPADAKVAAMPRNAMAYLKPDYQLRADEMGPLLVSLVEKMPVKPAANRLVADLEDAAVRNQPVGPRQMNEFGKDTPYICPECGGPLWEARQGPPRMRCHAGHAYTAADLITRYGEQKEAILWSAVRVLEEQAALMTGQSKLGNRSPQERKDMMMAGRRNTDSALVVRKLLSQLESNQSRP